MRFHHLDREDSGGMESDDATAAVAAVAQTVTSTVHAVEGVGRHPVVSFLSAFLWLFGEQCT